MLDYDRIDISEGIGTNKTRDSHEYFFPLHVLPQQKILDFS